MFVFFVFSLNRLLSVCYVHITFQRNWRATLKVNIQFKVNKVKIQFKVNKIKMQFKVNKVKIQFKVNKVKIQFKVNKVNIQFKVNKVNIQFKVNKVKILFADVKHLFCWFWLACTDRATYFSTIVYFEWSQPSARQFF